MFSRPSTEYIVNVWKVRTILKNAEGTHKLKKYIFFTKTIDCVGQFIRASLFEISSHTTHALRGRKDLTNQSELGSFLRLHNVYRRFLPIFAKLVAPLNSNLRNDKWTAFQTLSWKQHWSIQSLNAALMSPPVLALFNSTGHLKLDTDACNVQVVFLLLEEQSDKTVMPIGYCWRSRKDGESRYDTSQWECDAMLWATHFLPHILKIPASR